MNLLKYAESFKRKMTETNYQLFLKRVKQSVDLGARNTSNTKKKDLALHQIATLAEYYVEK